MQNNTIELSLLDPEEKEMLEYIWNMIPEQDRNGMTKDDVLFVLDVMDDFLEEKGLVSYDEKTEEAIYNEGEVDETEQLEYILSAARDDHRSLSSVQVQLVMDAELQYGIEQGYYEDE